MDGTTESSNFFTRWREQAPLNPSLARAVRTTLASSGSLLICLAAGLGKEAMYVALAAQGIALNDLRGGYSLRLGIVAVMSLALTAATFLGVLAGNSLWMATAGMLLIAVSAGFWRHANKDYGPLFGVYSVMLYSLALSEPASWQLAIHLAGLSLMGGVAAAAVHTVFWLFRRQYQVRNTVAEVWVALSDLAASMLSASGKNADARSAAIAARERDLRVAMDQTFAILAKLEPKKGRQPPPLLAHLEEMRREAVHFAMRLIGFNTAIEAVSAEIDVKRYLPVIDSVLKALSDAARSIAITLVNHRPDNFAASELRIRQALHLVRVLERQLPPPESSVEIRQARAMLERIRAILPVMQNELSKTVEHGGSRFNLPVNLPEIGSQSLKILTRWMDLRATLDPVLLRHSARVVVLTALAILVYKGFHIHHGYWIALTMIIVLQPDYGSTRKRAGERILGTLAGVVLASGFLWLQMPYLMLGFLIPISTFGFAYNFKSDYTKASFFVTLKVVLITSIGETLNWEFTASRMLSTLFGGVTALIAAQLFWPQWEKGKFPGMLAAAIRANGRFLESMFPRQTERGVLRAKRAAETANRLAATSLQRMLTEPASRNVQSQRDAALVNYNPRITRAFTAIAVHQDAGVLMNDAATAGIVSRISEILETLARAVENEGGPQAVAIREVEEKLEELEPLLNGRVDGDTELIWMQLAKAVTEIQAMILELEEG
ncbi:MAG TPA: FUSC family protein [Chthoniobacterales bacterium]